MPTLTLLDWKSSSFRSAEELLQLAAYWACPEWCEEGAWVTWEERATSAAIVHVGEHDCKPVVQLDGMELQAAFEVFCHAKSVFDWMVAKGRLTIPQNEEYRIGDIYLPSVTTILGKVIAKPALMNWYYDKGIEAVMELVSRKLMPEPMEKDRIKQLADEEQLSPTAQRDAKGDMGSTLHKNIVFFLEGKTVDTTQAPTWLSGALTQVAQWTSRVKLEPIALERKVCHRDLGYAGRMDCVAWVEWNSREAKPNGAIS